MLRKKKIIFCHKVCWRKHKKQLSIFCLLMNHLVQTSVIFIMKTQWNYETLNGCVNYNQKQLKFYSYKFFHLIAFALFCCESRYSWEIASNFSMPNTSPCRDLVSFALAIFSRFRDYLGHFSAQTRKIKIKHAQGLYSLKIKNKGIRFP